MNKENMKPFSFSLGKSYTVIITALSYLDALTIWDSLIQRNYYPSSKKVIQTENGYEIQ